MPDKKFTRTIESLIGNCLKIETRDMNFKISVYQIEGSKLCEFVLEFKKVSPDQIEEVCVKKDSNNLTLHDYRSFLKSGNLIITFKCQYIKLAKLSIYSRKPTAV